MGKLTAIREGLQESIEDLDRVKYMFVAHATRDFTRENGLLRFRDMIQLLLGMGTGTLKRELLQYYEWSSKTPSAPGFVEQRCKILPSAFEFLFRDHLERFEPTETFRGFHLVAGDATGLPIAPNENDELTYIRESENSRPYAFVRLCLLYDLLEDRYVDVLIQPAHGDAEIRSLSPMIDRYRGPENTIVILDRGYESWENIGHVIQSGMYYLMRAKAPTNRGGILQSLQVPKEGTYDVDVHVALTRSISKAAKELPGYKRLGGKVDFDLVDRDRPVYELDMRVVRVQLPDGTIETLITSLPRDLFSDEDLRELYWFRWGEESSFSTLKYDEGLLELHSKTPQFILQEIFAHLVMYNVDSLMRNSLPRITQHGKHKKRYDTAVAVTLCRAFLRDDVTESALQSIMERTELPIRANYGAHPRIRRFHGSAPFRYRPAV